MNKQYKDIIKHALVYGVTGILARAVGFLMIPIYTRYLTPADYGVIELLDLFLTVAGTFLNMGINMSVFKFYFSYDDELDRKRVISTSILLVMAASGGFIIVGMGSVNSISKLLFQSGEYASYIQIIFFTFFFDNVANIMLSFIRAKQRSVLFSAISIIRLVIALSLNIYLIMFLEMGVYGVLYSSLISGTLAGVMMGVYTFREVGFRFSLRNARELLRFGLPLVPTSVGMFVIHFGDRFFLQRFSDLTELGIYSLAYKFGFMINLVIVMPFSLLWDAKMFEIDKQPDAKEIYSKIFTYLVFTLIFCASVMTIMIKDIMRFMVAEEFFIAYKIIPYIAFAYVLNGSCYMLRVGLYIRGKTEYTAVIMGITSAFAILMYYALIPGMGAKGAAIATLVSFIFWNILTYFVNDRVYRIKYEWGRIFKLSVASLSIVLLSRFVILENYHLSITVKSLISLSFPVVLLALNFYRQSEFDMLKKMAAKAVRLKT